MFWDKNRVPLTPLIAIQNELIRLHEELDSFGHGSLPTMTDSYALIVKEINKLNDHLIELSKNEKK